MRDPVVLRPAVASYRKQILQLSPLAVGGLAYATFLVVRDPGAMILLPVTVAGALLGLWRFFTHARIVIDHEGIRSRKVLREKSIPTDEIGLIVFVPDFRPLDARMHAFLSVTDHRGRRRILMTAPFWTVHQMRHVAAAVDAPVQVVQSATPREVSRTFPRALPLWIGRPWLTSILIVVALLAAVFVLAVVVVAAGELSG